MLPAFSQCPAASVHRDSRVKMLNAWHGRRLVPAACAADQVARTGAKKKIGRGRRVCNGSEYVDSTGKQPNLEVVAGCRHT